MFKSNIYKPNKLSQVDCIDDNEQSFAHTTAVVVFDVFWYNLRHDNVYEHLHDVYHNVTYDARHTLT